MNRAEGTTTRSDSPRAAGLKTRLAKHLAACTAAAIATSAAVAPDASAAVVYYQPNGGAGWVIPATSDGLYINVETQVTDVDSGNVPGWDLNPYGSSQLTWFSGGSGTLMLRFPGVTVGSAGNLAIGTQVDGFGSYGIGDVTVGDSPGEWKLNASNYFGFSFFADDSQIRYGWGRMDIGAAITTRTIMEIGYEDVAGVGILVGAGAPEPGPDPVPGPLPLFGAGAAFGWSRRLRRRSLLVSSRSANPAAEAST